MPYKSTQDDSVRSKFFLIYIIGFLFHLHVALPTYVNSTFLAGFSGEKFVGLIYTLSSIFTIAFFVYIPHVLEKIGNYRAIISLMSLQFVALMGLAFGNNLIVVASAFIVSFVTISLSAFSIDVFIEEFSPNESVGKIRGFFLTIVNLAWILSPLLVCVILTNGDYYKVYLAAAILLLPAIGIVHKFKKFRDPFYNKTPYLKTMLATWKDKDVLGSLIINFLLNFFFAWMVIYTPIYLYQHIGFSWSQIGIIFSIMLVPFAILEIPLGKLADSKYGEKEILSIGFIIMSISTALISFISSNNFIIWTLILFTTRTGAAMVEIMIETYFFKKVPDTEVNILSLFRTMRPWAYLISPVAASFLFVFVDIRYIFIFLGLLMFYGLRFTLALKDTK